MKRQRALFSLTALVALLATAPLWLPAVGLVLVVADPLAPADAIVPLAGDLGERVEYAVMLLETGYAPRLVISDMVRRGTQLTSESNQALALAAGVAPNKLVATERVVRSTYSELGAIHALAQRENWRTLIIVTSPEHTRRTQLMANEIFGDGTMVVRVRPVEGYGYHPARWWQSEPERRLTLLEYPKLLAYLLGYRR